MMVKKVFSGGEKLEAKLRELSLNLAEAGAVEIGWPDGARYPDGTYVAQIAAQNEFGDTIHVDEKSTTLYRKIDRSGNFMNNGRFVKRARSNFATEAKVPAHIIVIPPRPFARNMIAQHSDEWGSDVAKALKAKDYHAKQALAIVGEKISGQMQKSIIDFSDPKNAPSTVRRKGFDKPLIDTHVMLDTVKYVVKS